LKRVLIVSPHRDDAAFSCAIAISQLTRHWSVTVANCFTVSRYAPLADVPSAAVTELRHQEDVTFSTLANVSLSDLHLLDAPERLSIGVSEISTLRPLDERDREPLVKIRQHVLEFAADIVFAPLGLGNHIDHRIAQSATVAAKTGRLAFYEDLPYAARLPYSAPRERAALLGLNLVPHVIRSTEGNTWKARCVNCYPSQVGSETVAEISQFSKRYGNGECLWAAPEVAAWLSASVA